MTGDGAGEGQRIHSFTHEGLTFDVLDEGPVEGPAIVLLHGFPERASQWDAVGEILHRQGFRTLAPDQRGYSPGARPSGRSAYRMSKLVGDVAALIEAYGAPVHLVGHDWGAAVAWATAATHPELVRTLTTVSVPHPSAFVRSMLVSEQALRSWYMLAIQVPGGVELLARRRPATVSRLLRRGGMRREDVDRFWTDIVEYGALPGALAWYRAIPLSARSGTPPVRVPTTHVWSDRDTALSRRGAELTASWVRAPYELVVLQGVGHWIPTRVPETLAEIVVARVNGASAP